MNVSSLSQGITRSVAYIEYFNDCPKCKAEIKRMYISERALKNVDFRHREYILAQSENWII